MDDADLDGLIDAGSLRVGQVAQHLGLHMHTVKRIPYGVLPYQRIGARGDRRYRVEDVNRYILMGRSRAAQEPSGADLTPREMEVLRGRASGKTRDELMHELGISRTTFSAHEQNAYQKLGVGSIIQAFLALGWLRLPPEGRQDG